ncbi:hypothetical protein MKX03_032301, partial [Papaver bracteatum]
GSSPHIQRSLLARIQGQKIYRKLLRRDLKPVNMLMSSWIKQMGYPVSVQLKDNKLEFDQ